MQRAVKAHQRKLAACAATFEKNNPACKYSSSEPIYTICMPAAARRSMFLLW